MKKDIKYIIKRVIIGILIGLFFLMFKSKISYAATLNGTLSTKYNSDNCSVVQGSMFCTTGNSYLFRNTFSSTNQSTTTMSFPYIDTSNNGVMITNIDFVYNFSTPVTIGDNDSIQITYYPFLATSGHNFSFYSIYPYYFDNSNYIWPFAFSNLNYRPIYVAYNLSSDDSNTWHSTAIHFRDDASSGNISFFKLYDIPSGSSVQKIRIIFGTTKHYNGATQITNGYTMPQLNDNWVVRTNGSTTIPSNYYITWEQYKEGTSDDIGLVYLAQNSDTLPHFHRNWSILGYYSSYPAVQTVSNRYHTEGVRSIVFDLSNVSIEDISPNTYLENIETQIAINQATIGTDLNGEDKDYVNPLYNSWNNTYTNGFTSLFSTLFAYPLTKIEQQVNNDLVRQNINGSYILNSRICMKNMGQDSVLDEYVPYQVQFWRDYKFDLPCPHTEIYTKLKYGDYAFYGTNFLGANLGTQIGGSYNFVSIWLTIQHGLLVYLLFVNVLNIYKYILDSNKAEVEVLEL